MLSIATTLYIAATHSITHSPCTSTCTPSTTNHPDFYNPLHTTKKKHKVYLCKQRQNGTKCRDGVKVLLCHSHLVFVTCTFYVLRNACNQIVSSSLLLLPCSWVCTFLQQQLYKFFVVTGASKVEWCQASFARKIDKWLCIMSSSVLHIRKETSRI